MSGRRTAAPLTFKTRLLAIELATPSKRHAGNLAQSVTATLIQRIRSGELRPGDKLPTESELMTSLGVSRTVIREAISGLQVAALVETRHGVGTFVLAPQTRTRLDLGTEEITTLLDVLAVMEVRISLEVEAAGLAATRRTDAQLRKLRSALKAFEKGISDGSNHTVEADIAFHLAIANATGNTYFHAVLEQLGQAIIPRARVNSAAMAGTVPADYLRRVQLEHQSIYDAILHHEPDVARAAMRTHLANSRSRLRGKPDVG